MKDGDRPSRGTNPDNRRIRRSAPASRQGGYVGRGVADDGRSGYGSESVRPYLRAQLRLKELMQGPQLGTVDMPDRNKTRKDD